MLGENPQSELRPPETRAGVLRSRVGDMRAETNGVKWCLVAWRTPCGVHPWNETQKPGTALARRRQGGPRVRGREKLGARRPPGFGETKLGRKNSMFRRAP